MDCSGFKHVKEGAKPQSEFSKKKLLIEAAVRRATVTPYVSTLVQKLAVAENRKNL